MAYGINPHEHYSYGAVNDENVRRFRRSLGLSASETPTSPSLASLQTEVRQGDVPTFADFGRSIRNDLSSELDKALLASELEALEGKIDHVPTVREKGIPEHGETPYQELTGPGWRVVDHLGETGFFAGAERHLPSFSSEYIEDTTQSLLFDGAVVETLGNLGLSDGEQLALLTNIVNSSEQLSWWDRTEDYPGVEEPDEYDEGIVHDHIAPLQQRAMEGTLLWLDGLDWWLWQQEILITDDMLDKSVWDIKSMLVGSYLFTDAARGVAAGTISDERLAAQVTASSAIMIIGQEFLIEDVVRIDGENRAPRQER